MPPMTIGVSTPNLSVIRVFIFQSLFEVFFLNELGQAGRRVQNDARSARPTLMRAPHALANPGAVCRAERPLGRSGGRGKCSAQGSKLRGMASIKSEKCVFYAF